MYPVRVSTLVLSAFLGSFALSAVAGSDLANKLQEFKTNPVKFMNQIPAKKYSSAVRPFSNEDIANKSYISAKNKLRPSRGRSAIVSNDRAENLVDNSNSMVRKLEEMSSKKLESARVPTNPWSDYYWAIYTGQTAYRYADSDFPNSKNWKENADYLLSNAANSTSVDSLSPAEKYDLLVGDSRKTLTHSAISEGESYYRSNGKVEDWMGICHGWSPAAYMMDRPTHKTKILAADGKTLITFYPADIKALASLLWATNAPSTKFIGGRCDQKNPKTDRNGRIIDQDCFDTNPGSWHTAIVNQIGVSKRSFVADVTYDYEVWNQPMLSYKYTYFNPQTLKPADSIKEASVKMSDFSSDKFSKYRSKNAVRVVGVNMELTYIVETNPTQEATDGAENDAVNSVEYQYDLEIDANDNIIGGEWYVNAHPDFLWTPAIGAKARTSGDDLLARTGADKIKWDGKTAFPREWMDAAQRTSSQSPLATVVEALIQFSQAGI